MISKVFALQRQTIKNNMLAFVLLLLTLPVVLYVGYRHDAGHGHTNLIQGIGYIIAMTLCAFCIDLVIMGRATPKEFEVRKPLKETIITLLCAAIGVTSIFLRFFAFKDWNTANPWARLGIIVGFMLFLYPLGLAIIMLVMRYNILKFLSVKPSGLIAALLVIAITYGTSRLISHDKFTWSAVLQESGGSVINALFNSFIVAALSEEFFRVVAMTRIGALLKSKGLGLYLTALIWGLMHGPKWYADSGDVTDTFLSCVRLVPLGMVWGYLTLRTKSILPSVLVHGTNVWGLQNF